MRLLHIQLIPRSGTLGTLLGCQQEPAHSLEKTDLAGPAANTADIFLVITHAI